MLEIPCDDEKSDALEWIKIYVLGNNVCGEGQEVLILEDGVDVEEIYKGKTIGSEKDAKEIVNALSTQQRKDIFHFLYGHVHPEYQGSMTSSKKDLILWLQKPNLVRNYLFYKANGLKDLMDAKNISVIGRCNKEDRINALAGMLPPDRLVDKGQKGTTTRRTTKKDKLNLLPKEAAIVKMLERSFLPHQKGDAREHCSHGHRLEKPILKNWIKHVENENDSSAPGLTVRSAYTAGLAEKKNAPHAKDSIDFILLVKQKKEGQQEGGALESWGFEAKGRLTSRTALEEEEDFSSTLFNKHNRINDSEVFEMVRKESERFQVLQHAYVYGFPTVVLAISDAHSELLRTTIIDFSDELKNHFGIVLEEMKNFILNWLYNNPCSNKKRAEVVKVPDQILNLSKHVPNINGIESLQGGVNLWMSLSLLPSPIPSFHRLIPAIYAFWNAVKGGSDTTTKLMDDCILFMPHKNCETVASSRLLMLLFVLNHRLFQLFSSNEDPNEYSSLYHYRKAATKRCTFHQTLLYCNNIFRNELKRIRDEEEKKNKENDAPVNDVLLGHRRKMGSKTRNLPNRTKFDDVVPERVTFGPLLPMNTPQKMTKAVERGEADDYVSSMISSCTGVPVKVHKTDYRARCDTCKAKTNWYCIGCKRWFCMDRRNVDENNKEKNLYAHKVKGRDFYFQRQCFHQAHEAQWNTSSC